MHAFDIYCKRMKFRLFFFSAGGVYSTHFAVSCTTPKYATLYDDLLPFCPLSIHAVLKAEEKGWE